MDYVPNYTQLSCTSDEMQTCIPIDNDLKWPKKMQPVRRKPTEQQHSSLAVADTHVTVPNLGPAAAPSAFPLHVTNDLEGEKLYQACVAGDNEFSVKTILKHTARSLATTLPAALLQLTINTLRQIDGNFAVDVDLLEPVSTPPTSTSTKRRRHNNCCQHEHERPCPTFGAGGSNFCSRRNERLHHDGPVNVDGHLKTIARANRCNDSRVDSTVPGLDSVVSVSALPAETMWHILSFVAPTDLRCNVRLVCQQWKALADDELLWKRLCEQQLNLHWAEEEVRRTTYKWSEYYWQLMQYKDDFQTSYFDEDKKELGCQHYKRNNKILAACCNRFYACRHCHNINEDHMIDRYATAVMFCMVCRTIQPKGPVCRSNVCNGRQLAIYYCNICNFWDNCEGKAIFHCPDCNVCYLGRGLGIDYYHCQECNMCFDMRFSATHRHLKKSDELQVRPPGRPSPPPNSSSSSSSGSSSTSVISGST